jgi:hypothetical protein
MKQKFNIADKVSVYPKDGYPSFSFVGRVTDYIKETNEYIVQDDEDDLHLLDEDQLGDDFFDGISE